MGSERPPKVYRLTRGSHKGELDGPRFGGGVRLSHRARSFLRDVDVVEKLHRLAEVDLALDGALAGFVFLDDPEFVQEG